MKEVRFSLEYGAYPVWIFEDGDLMDYEDIVSRFAQNKRLALLLDELEKEYDALFIDNKIEFRFVGFSTLEQKKLFADKVNEAFKLLKLEVGGEVEIVNWVDVDSMWQETH